MGLEQQPSVSFGDNIEGGKETLAVCRVRGHTVGLKFTVGGLILEYETCKCQIISFVCKALVHFTLSFYLSSVDSGK